MQQMQGSELLTASAVCPSTGRDASKIYPYSRPVAGTHLAIRVNQNLVKIKSFTCIYLHQYRKSRSMLACLVHNPYMFFKCKIDRKIFMTS